MIFPQMDRLDDPQWARDYGRRVGSSVIIPFLSQQLERGLDGMEVLDIGCGSGGILSAFVETGALCTGIDRNESRIAFAQASALGEKRSPRFILGDVLHTPLPSGSFDLVLLIEVVEHLQDLDSVERVLRLAGQLVSSRRGWILVTFPPYRSPFGGHQAGWPKRIYLPWIHLLPRPILRLLAPSAYVDYVDTQLNRITLSAFEQCVDRCDLTVEHRALYFSRPEYAIRYGVRPIPQISFLQRISWLLEFSTTGAYYLLANADETV